MRERRYEIVLSRGASDQLTPKTFAAAAEIQPGMVEIFVAYIILEPAEYAGPVLLFDPADVAGQVLVPARH